MADRYLLENNVDAYLLEDSSGDLIIDTAASTSLPVNEDYFFGTTFTQAGDATSQTLKVGGWGDNYHAMLKSDITSGPAAADTVAAYFWVYQTNAAPNDPVTTAYKVTQSWSEASMVANPGPSFTTQQTIIGGYTNTIGWKQIDITDLYKDWKSGAASNFGITLRGTQTGADQQSNLAAREYTTDTTKRPYIEVISYAPDDVEALQTITGKARITKTVDQTQTGKAEIRAIKTYSRGDYAALPTNEDDLETFYSTGDVTNVDTSDNVRIAQAATGQYAIHMFRYYAAALTSANITWEGQSDMAASTSSIVLQVYNYNTAAWETLQTNTTAAANTDFNLTGNLGTLTNYKDGSGFMAFRVYQLSV